MPAQIMRTLLRASAGLAGDVWLRGYIGRLQCSKPVEDSCDVNSLHTKQSSNHRDAWEALANYLESSRRRFVGRRF